MTRISFYLLAAATERERFACQLAEKAHHQGQRSYLHCADTAQAQALDDLLWTFRQGSFLPHTLAADEAANVAVHVGTEPAAAHGSVMINLAAEVPPCFSRFERVLELVHPNDKQAARSRYKFYKDRGYALETHDLSHN